VNRIRPTHFVLLILVLLILIWSAWHPADRLTWWLEVFPALAGLIFLAATYRRFPLTTLCYVAIVLHMSILFVGGHYTYARVPFFDWLRPVLGLHRNNFDRIGHFAQGFVPALIARELFIRLRILNRQRWQPFLIVCICLAISATYELIEWMTASIAGDDTVSFLATQGDVWDTQKDMLTALIGAILSLALLHRVHDRALARLKTPGR
jgi:putative membrane protein